MKVIKKYWSWIPIALFFLSSTWYLAIYKDNILIQVHDNLDSNIAVFKMMRDNQLFFGNDGTVPWLGGISHKYLRSGLLLNNLLYFIFPTFIAYVLSFFIRIILSIGGSVLLAKVVLKETYRKYYHLIILCSFLYGIFPYYPTYYFGFASLPLFVYLIYQLYYTRKKKYFIFLFLYPSLSCFIGFGLFLCLFLGIFMVIDSILHKKVNVYLLLGLVMLSLGYIVMEYRLFNVFIFSNEKTIRDSMEVSYVSFSQAFRNAWDAFLNGHYHSGTLQKKWVMPICILYFLINNAYKIYKRKYKAIFCDIFNITFLFAFINTLFFGFDKYYPLKNIIATLIPPLTGFSYARALWLNPFLIHVCFFIVLTTLIKNRTPFLAYTIAFIGIFVIFQNGAVYNDIESNISRILDGQKETSKLTYREFYSEHLFNQIKEDISYENEKSVAFGFHPSILIYNKIFTLDGYLSNVPQSYKDEFRKLIEPALKLDKEYQTQYDKNERRLYLVMLDGTYEPIRDFGREEAELYFNPQVFREMGGTYIFSRVIINNADEMELSFIKGYQDSQSPYTIYVYKINHSHN